MKCPNCGFEFEEEAYECPHCGIVFAKWEELQQKKAEGLVEIPTWYQKHISPTARILRAFGSLISLGLAAFLLLAGALSSSVGAFIVMAFYLVFGLYLLFTSTIRVKIGQFAIEGVTLLVVSLIAFLAIPLPGRMPNHTATYNETTKQPVPQEVVTYIDAVNSACNGIEKFITTKKLKDDNEAVELVNNIGLGNVDKAFFALSPKMQENMAYSHAMLHNLEPLLLNLQTKMPKFLPKGPATWLPKAIADSVRKHVENTRTQLNREKINLMSTYRFNVADHAGNKSGNKK